MPVEVAPPLSMTAEQREAVERMARSSSLPQRKVVQARALLLAADGVGTNEVARRCGTTDDSVRRWRRRFEVEGPEGIGRVASGRGRKSWLAPGTLAGIVRLTCTTVPDDDSTQWSTRTLAERVGVGKDTVARAWRAHGLRPWRRDTFKLCTDPALGDKLVDVVGLYMDPPARERAVVLCFDEKTQVQALDRTQPSLPITRGRAATLTHDYRRNGTTDLFAAMDMATGEVLYDCRRGHTGADVLRFFKLIDAHVPRPLELHVVLDNLSAHKAPEVRDWLAHPHRRRWHLHFTPTSSSWLNLIERWFKELTDRRLRHGVFTSVAALETAIETWAEHWNDDPRPFTWHGPAAGIITKVQRARDALTRTSTSGLPALRRVPTPTPRAFATRCPQGEQLDQLGGEDDRLRHRKHWTDRHPAGRDPDLEGLGGHQPRSAGTDLTWTEPLLLRSRQLSAMDARSD